MLRACPTTQTLSHLDARTAQLDYLCARRSVIQKFTRWVIRLIHPVDEALAHSGAFRREHLTASSAILALFP